ncbi:MULTISPECIES: lipase family alpha/beta hydrolase [Pseudonocardia]|uniref:Alpha/beta hydrolase family protein n=2 Tax=Pseudonocardia TaxID=1847 RepID=A0A1Y2N8J6_PSEAH|nr:MULTISPECIES: alpha/beta fold hydrolase [Pseudonocardia]OSY43521.1 Alpha/beta hydrolase family protein [Pseudonocardia autotrophica]TDN73486.1 alpha/beta hydrolase family protein [Pseudonocardia autotrophica]BBG04228.1 hypothetical protein Pdca_54370 [Pseudonocardia autotrophica]GEC29444.1 hypothetical protein PSA01_64730 [Pseudonocardia saturnea]
MTGALDGTGPEAAGAPPPGTARVVLVHGAWHRGSSWAAVTGALERSGVPVSAPDLPSESGGYEDQVAAVLAVAGHGEHAEAGRPGEPGEPGQGDRSGARDGAEQPERSGERDGAGPSERSEEPVVLVGHSLGGLAATVAAARLGPGRVRALVLVGALVPEPGRPQLDRLRSEGDLMVAGYDAGVRRGDGPVTYWPDAATTVAGLYRGVAEELAGPTAPAGERAEAEQAVVATPAGERAEPDPTVATAAAGERAEAERAVATAVAELRPQDWSLLREPCPIEAWPGVRTVSVICADDRVVDPVAGRREAARVGAEIVEIPGGHFPMLTRPAALAGLLADLAVGTALPVRS